MCMCPCWGVGITPYFPKVKNADGTNAKDETGTTNVLKRNPDGCIHSFSSEQGKLVKIVNREHVLLIVRDVRCKRSGSRHQTSKNGIDENAKILKY